MSATREFYLSRASECAAEAERAVLDNVRERCLRSESAWRAMADRLTSVEANRQRNLAGKEELALTDVGDAAEQELVEVD